jgi:predicted XRE-type DNA-binding protein
MLLEEFLKPLDVSQVEAARRMNIPFQRLNAIIKGRLTLQIYRIIKARRVTQAQAGATLGIRQPQVSLLMRNRSGNFSVERLMDFLTALGHDVEVRVTPTRKEHGRLSVIVAA